MEPDRPKRPVMKRFTQDKRIKRGVRMRSMFVQEYLLDFNATRAAVRAGYSANSASTTANKLMKEPFVIQGIADAVDRRAARADVKADHVVKELAKLAFSDMRDYAIWDGASLTLIRSQDLPAGASAAVAEVNETTTASGGSATRIKLYSKIDALTTLARHLGMFVDKTETTVKVDAGLYDKYTLDQLDAMHAKVVDRPKLPAGDEGEGTLITEGEGIVS
jgi:phage terminase small subunit